MAAADGAVSAFGDAADHGSLMALGITGAGVLDLVTVPRPPVKVTVPTTTTTPW